VVHAPLVHRNGEQSTVWGLGIVQLPVPLHVCAKVSIVPLHEAAWHTVPLGQSWQAAPLHTPLVPQVLMLAIAHWFFGSVPEVTALHVPFGWPVSAFEQARQVPVQALLQQKPSTQLPLWHWWFAPHAPPCATFARHMPLAPVQ
jgi:hypothetical protein